MQLELWYLADGKGPVSASMRLDDRDWEKMDRPSLNGLYSMVESLGWWGDSV